VLVVHHHLLSYTVSKASSKASNKVLAMQFEAVLLAHHHHLLYYTVSKASKASVKLVVKLVVKY
jgi:hypothetical protein